MKITKTFPLAAFFAVFALTVGAITSPAIAQNGTVTPNPGVKVTASPKPAFVGRDYLVLVGKHTMWKSQVEKMHPEMRKQMVTISKANNNDYPVTIGKRTVMASTLRRNANDANTRPATHNRSCKDYLVQVGKQAVLASSINCPMGKHEGQTKPLCCVSPVVASGSSLPNCCKDVKGL